MAGVTEIDVSVAGVTVRVVDPEMLPDVAVTVVIPVPAAAADPLEPVALLIVATFVEDELQITAVVMSCVVSSENVPVAVNCLDEPVAMLGLVGVIARDTRTAGVTVRVVDPDTLPVVAPIVVVPTSMPVTYPAWLAVCAPVMIEASNPRAFAEASTIATEVLEELQATESVRSCVVLSE